MHPRDTLALMLTLVATLVLPLPPANASATKRIALLVGVGDYRDREIRDLEGPPHDVFAMQAVLTGKWGFNVGDVRTLVDGEATRSRILAELDALKTRSHPGDLVFIYLSGHGTSDRDRDAGLPLPHTSGAFLPVDFPYSGTQAQQLASVIIGKRDVRPRLEALEESGRRIYAVYDSCFSGNAVRSIGSLPSRYVPLITRGARDEIEMSADLGNRPVAPPYPYRQVFFLAAASDNERAADISGKMLSIMPTMDGRPHGAFTDALLRALDQPASADIDHDGELSNGELYEAVASFMDRRSYGHHPQMLPPIREDSQHLAQRGLFATEQVTPAVAVRPGPRPAPGQQATAAEGPVRVKVEGDDRVWRQVLGALPGVQLVESDSQFVLRQMPGRKQLLVWRLFAPNGDIVTDGDDPDVQDVADIFERLKAEVWYRKVQGSMLAKRRFAPTLEANPASRGGTFVEGETMAFDLRSDQTGNLLLLNVDAHGKVTVLYPFTEAELKPLAAGTLHVIPGKGPKDRIKVTPPSGTDQLLAVIFPKDAPVLASLRGKSGIGVDDPELTRLAATLESGITFGAATYTLRTLTKEAAQAAAVGSKP